MHDENTLTGRQERLADALVSTEGPWYTRRNDGVVYSAFTLTRAHRDAEYHTPVAVLAADEEGVERLAKALSESDDAAVGAPEYWRSIARRVLAALIPPIPEPEPEWPEPPVGSVVVLDGAASYKHTETGWFALRAYSTGSEAIIPRTWSELARYPGVVIEPGHKHYVIPAKGDE